ncbi:MAG: type II toxin-antitoxin system VapC family toxin [Vicinamibacterales bacterium]
MGLIADIGQGAIAIDTSIFIYFIEEHPRFLPLVVPLFEEADKGRRDLITSAVTLLEVLVVPYRAGAVHLAERYELLLTRSRGIRMMDITRGQLRTAAQLRAALGTKTPDALQLVCAMATGCKTFVTNDRGLPQVPGLRVIQLSSYVDVIEPR